MKNPDCNPVEIISLNIINPVNMAQYLSPNVFEIAEGNIVYVALFINHKQQIHINVIILLIHNGNVMIKNKVKVVMANMTYLYDRK